MLIEEVAYTNPWRRVSPGAKGLFSLCGMIAAFIAPSPRASLLVAALILAVTLLGARVPLWRYFRIALPELLFLVVAAAPLAVSISWNGHLQFRLADQSELQRIAILCGRSLASIAALLFLCLSTPMNDIIALLRRLRFPEVLLDIMTLGYRTIFVFLEVIRDTTTAQSARMGYATSRLAIRSLGILAANLTTQVWQRSHDLHQAALARNNTGPLRFLGSEGSPAGGAFCMAATGGALLMLIALVPL